MRPKRGGGCPLRPHLVGPGRVVGLRSRSTLPTDEHCDAFVRRLEQLGLRRWALAMRLTARTALRWGELVALQAGDIDFNPRVVHLRRAVERGSSGPATLKKPKNGKTHTTIYPRSLEPDLRRLVADTLHRRGPAALLFSNMSRWVRPAQQLPADLGPRR